MRSMTSRPTLTGAVDGGDLEFELVRLPCSKACGVVRRLKLIGVGLFEMNVFFESRDAFLQWMEIDEYRHQAPGLMAFVKNRFDELYYSAEDAHG